MNDPNPLLKVVVLSFKMCSNFVVKYDQWNWAWLCTKSVDHSQQLNREAL